MALRKCSNKIYKIKLLFVIGYYHLQQFSVKFSSTFKHEMKKKQHRFNSLIANIDCFYNEYKCLTCTNSRQSAYCDLKSFHIEYRQSAGEKKRNEEEKIQNNFCLVQNGNVYADEQLDAHSYQNALRIQYEEEEKHQQMKREQFMAVEWS